MGVIVVDEALDVGNQLAHAAKGSAANCLLGNDAKPALDLVEPTGVGGRGSAGDSAGVWLTTL
jgi:hypothetical protein